MLNCPNAIFDELSSNELVLMQPAYVVRASGVETFEPLTGSRRQDILIPSDIHSRRCLLTLARAAPAESLSPLAR